MKLILFAFVFCVAYFVYHLTLYPSVSGGDSGELLAEACQLGTAHPPGYPLFTLLSHCALYLGGFPRLFWNASSGNLVVDTKPTSGWKMNNLTAIFASLAAAFIALACLEMTLITSIQPLEKKGRYRHTLAPSSLAALSFAFSSLVWEYAIGAEVFALNNLFCAIIIYLTVSIIADSSENRSSESSEYLPIGRTMFWYCLLGAFTCGLALSNQHSSALLIAVAVPSVLVAISSRDIGPSFLFLLSVSFVFGLLSYNYLMFASLHPKPGSWGDLGNIYGFLNHVLRREYGTFSLGMTQGAEGFLERIWIYLLHLFDDGLMHSLVPLVIFGVCGVLFDHNSMFNTTMSNMSMKRIENDKLMQERKLSGTDSAFKKSKKKRLKEKRDKPEGLDDRVSINKKSDTLKVESSKQRNFAEGKATGPTVSSVSTGFRKDLKQYWVLLFVVASWAFYVVVWNGVLSNIPLSAPMPYGVHARFWMQPNIFVHILFGLGLHYLFRSISYTCFKNLNDLTNAAFEMSVVLAAILAIISGKFERLDMSQDGWLMHNYGLHILQSTSYPNDALLLSHTDLNWNTVRYLQTCENLSRNTTSLHSDVTLTHLNFQLMPFPWFEKQQAPIYPQVSFPPMFHGVSTQRMSTANAVLVDRFLKANMFFENDDVETEFPIWGRRRPTFLDMQAINDIHIDSGGTWRNYTLIPWGLVYLVHEKVHMQQLGAFHSYSLLQLKRLRKSFIPILHDNVTSLNKYLSTPIFIETVRNADVTENGQNVKVLFALSGPKKRVPFLLKFPPGSWEHAAISTFHDSHNQLGLNLLSFAMETQKEAKRHVDLLVIIDRLFVASDLLLSTVNSIESLVKPSLDRKSDMKYSLKEFAEGYAPISSPFLHLLKNTALSLMRLQSVLAVGVKFLDKMKELLTGQDSSIQELMLLDKSVILPLLTVEHSNAVRTKAIRSIEMFLEVAGADKDVEAFQRTLTQLKNP